MTISKISAFNAYSTPAFGRNSGVIAKYLGEDKNDKAHLVNIRNAKPSGMIGDAGYIKRFETKEAAKEYMAIVNKTHKEPPNKYVGQYTVITQPEADTFNKQH